MGLVHVSFHPILCGSCRSRQSWGSRARAFPRPAPILAQADLGDCTLTHSSGLGAVPPPKDPASRPAASCQETGLGHWLGCDPRPDLSFPADMGRGGAGAGSCSDHAGRSPGADATAPPPDLTGCRHRLRGQRRAQEARTRGPCRPPRLPPPRHDRATHSGGRCARVRKSQADAPGEGHPGRWAPRGLRPLPTRPTAPAALPGGPRTPRPRPTSGSGRGRGPG